MLPLRYGNQASDYCSGDDPAFLAELQDVALPGQAPDIVEQNSDPDMNDLEDYFGEESQREPEEEPPIRAVPAKRARESEGVDEAVYGAAHFGDFGEYMHRKRAKLQIQNAAFQSSGIELFKGLAIYINGWTQPSLQELRQLIVTHGGIFQPYLDKKGIVTHIVTCSLTPAKIREFQHMKVVRPEWLVQSAEKGVLLPWQDFVFRSERRPDSTQGILPTQQTLTSIPPAKSSFSAKLTTDPKTTKEAFHVPDYAAHKSNIFAQRAMGKPDWRQAHTSANPDFIEGYYKNSRLHHLSTWKAELRSLVQEAQTRAENGPSLGKVDGEDDSSAAAAGVSMRGAEFVMRSPVNKGKISAPSDGRVIMHCDFDCFFVSAGLLKRPELKGLPVVVCHSQGEQGSGGSTSEIASCSYEARSFGIKNGMSLQQARKLCPTIQTLPYEFELYKQLSLQFYTILMSHADDVQAVSVDEALIEVTSTVNRLRTKAKVVVDPAKEFAETIRAEIKRATGCEVSIGVSHNILLARLATRKAKPASSFHLLQVDAQQFVSALDISDLHGFGYSTKQKALDKLGTSALGDLANKSRAALSDALGKATGDTLYNAIRGIDDKKLESDKPRKSVSCEINYGIRFVSNEEAETFVKQMAMEVTRRLNDVGMLGKSLTLKIMKRDPAAPVEPPKFMGHGSCEVFNKQGPLVEPSGRATNNETVIGECAWRMLKSFSIDPRELRGIGIQIQKLESKATSTPSGQLTLPFQAGNRKDVSRAQAQLVSSTTNDRNSSRLESRSRSGTPLEMPTYSQLDQSIYQALPQDIRDEYEQEYQRSSKSPERPMFNPLIPSARPRSRSRSASLFPEKPPAQGVDVKRITAMLAPDRRGSTSPTKWKDFFGMRNGASRRPRDRMRVSDDDYLREAGVEPKIFRMLPDEVQREQLTAWRLQATEVADYEMYADQEEAVLRVTDNQFVVPNAPNAPAPSACYPEPVVLRQRGKEKGQTVHFTETDDVQKLIEDWVGKYTTTAPKDKDVDYFAKFLVRSVESPGGVEIERALSILKWWLVLLRRNWGSYENEESHDDDLVNQQEVGKRWWRVFREVKGMLDSLACRRFGGKLSLR